MKINEEKQKIVYDNFLKIISLNNPTYLTTRGFNSVSEYSTIATCKIMRIKWLGLLEGIGKKQDLLNYIVNEFKEFYSATKLASFAEFLKAHEYITYDLAYPFGFKAIKQLCGFNGSNQYTKEELINKYKEVKKKFGYVPSRAEFESVNKIDLKIFNNVFGLNTTKWEVLLEALGENEQNIQDLRNRLKVRNVDIAKKANKASKDKIGILTERQLEEEFKRTFDECYKNYNTYPTRRLFNHLSNYTDSAYRKRFNLRWSEIVSKYGYPPSPKNASEIFVLESIKKIVNCDYEAQMKWDWLIGETGKNLFCDGYFEPLNLVVEFDGVQHRRPIANMGGQKDFERRKIADNIKDKLLKENKINLLRIDSRSDWKNTDYLKSLLTEYI